MDSSSRTLMEMRSERRDDVAWFADEKRLVATGNDVKVAKAV